MWVTFKISLVYRKWRWVSLKSSFCYLKTVTRLGIWKYYDSWEIPLRHKLNSLKTGSSYLFKNLSGKFPERKGDLLFLHCEKKEKDRNFMVWIQEDLYSRTMEKRSNVVNDFIHLNLCSHKALSFTFDLYHVYFRYW